MATQNELMVKQIEYTRQLAKATQRIDSFNRAVYQGTSGMQVPENPEDQKAYNEYQEHQAGEREAVGEMYFNDISTSRDVDEG